MGLFDLLKSPSVPQKDNKAMKKEVSTPDVMFETEEIVPIEKRIMGQKPTCDGLFPHEILVLSYAHSFVANGENSFAGFWRYKYGIRDVQNTIDSLKEKGLVQVGTVKDAVNMEKLPVIKGELKKHELKVSGKKAELVERLLEAISEGELNAAFPKRPYRLTESGEVVLKKYEWIPFIHAHGIEDLDIWNLTSLVQQPPYMNYRDKIWGYLNERSLIHIKDKNFGLYRNCRFVMSEFVADEGKKELAFNPLCEVVAYDLSGLSNGFKIDFIDIYEESFFPYEKSIYTMAPGITKRIQDYGDEFRWSAEELRQHLLDGIARIQLPFRLFTNEECTDIVMDEIVGDKELLNSIYHIAEIRFKKKNK